MDSLAVGMQWTAGQLQQTKQRQQQQEQEADWLLYMRAMSHSLLSFWVCCSVALEFLEAELQGPPCC